MIQLRHLRYFVGIVGDPLGRTLGLLSARFVMPLKPRQTET